MVGLAFKRRRVQIPGWTWNEYGLDKDPSLLEACVSEGLGRGALAVDLGAEAGRIFALLSASVSQVLCARAFPKQVLGADWHHSAFTRGRERESESQHSQALPLTL